MIKYLTLLLPLLVSADLSAPSDLKLQALSSSHVSLSWKDNTHNETGYKIWRDGDLITVLPKDSTSYHDKGLLAHHTYHYTIKATDDSQALLDTRTTFNKEDNAIVVYDNTHQRYLMYAPVSDMISINREKFKVTTTLKKDVLGGFDYTLNIKNIDAHAQSLDFRIEIPGIMFADSEDIHILNTQTYMVPKAKKLAHNESININPTAEYSEHHTSYPDGYSPVIVAHDGDFSVGTAMLTTYDREQIALKELVQRNNNGSWSFVFESANPQDPDQNNAGLEGYRAKILTPGASQQINLTIRFSDVQHDKNAWIETLAPYKHFFNTRFSNKHIVHKDTSPILGMTFSYEGNVKILGENEVAGEDNPTQRGYGLGYFAQDNHAKENGETEYVDDLLAKLSENSYKRIIFWTVSGQYYGYHSEDEARRFNFPSQFVSHLLPNIDDITQDIQQRLQNYNYGFWWGRAGQIPQDSEDGHILEESEWNPQYIMPSNFHQNAYHLAFAKEQLQNALNLGAKEIGLDAFSNMQPTAQLDWIKEIKKEAPHVKFMQEGVMTDYLHTEFSMFLQPNIKWINKDKKADYTMRPILADYLNPDAEIIVWLNSDKYKKQSFIKKLMGYGFTPLLEVNNGEPSSIPEFHDAHQVPPKASLVATGNGNAYALINDAFTNKAYEVPCNHDTPHITQVWDDTLDKHVFAFGLHINDDGRCGKDKGRQRLEIKIHPNSNENLKGYQGNHFVYRWKFKLDHDFKVSKKFTHLHQLKAAGDNSATEVKFPLMTLTARQKNGQDLLEVRYSQGDKAWKSYSADLDLFRGKWVTVKEEVYYANDNGHYAITLKDLAGNTLLSYHDNNIRTWRNGADFIRPKWGIYRDLAEQDSLRDEVILYDSFSVGD